MLIVLLSLWLQAQPWLSQLTTINGKILLAAGTFTVNVPLNQRRSELDGKNLFIREEYADLYAYRRELLEEREPNIFFNMSVFFVGVECHPTHISMVL